MDGLQGHYDFDLSLWDQRFDDLNIAARIKESDYSIACPWTLVVVERERHRVRMTRPLGPAQPTDVFAIAYGEPPDRDVTKLGGLPYRPSGLPWPMHPNGTAMTFVGQFRFAESLDIIGEVPDDILLVFAVGDCPIKDEEDQPYFVFEWYSRGLQNLVMPYEIPESEWQFITCYGVRHRTVDYPEAERAFGNYGEGASIAILEGTKIGGSRRWLHNRCDIHGTLLCTLGSVNPYSDVPYPWVNVKEPIGWRESLSERYRLNWGDAGLVSIYLKDDGSLDWECEYY